MFPKFANYFDELSYDFDRVIEMRSFDSGRRKDGRKGRVEAHHALKVSDIPRERISTCVTEFVLTCQLGEGQGAKPVEQRVQLERVAAGFGGTRLYFRCPASECGRRVMVLYLVGERFLCRRCHRLA
jgi:hypothetical protein